MVMNSAPDWTLEHIRQHIDEGLPLAPLFNLEAIEATASRGRLRLNPGQHVLRPGGSMAGPVLFALADVVTYALILAR
jgi:acyl-coenzyme A thioesterase PaaI-like protein